MEPRPCKDENKAADEIKVDGTEDRKPMEPKPIKELVSCGVESMLDRDKDDK
jgi:hypothetical protein